MATLNKYYNDNLGTKTKSATKTYTPGIPTARNQRALEMQLLLNAQKQTTENQLASGPINGAINGVNKAATVGEYPATDAAYNGAAAASPDTSGASVQYMGSPIGNINSGGEVNFSATGLNDKYAEARKVLENALNAAKQQRQDQYSTSKSSLDMANEENLRQAYVNYMMNQRDLPQQMAAAGQNGGATETTLASLKNAYGENRRQANSNYLTNLNNLEMQMNDQIANDTADYNKQLSDINMEEVENAYQKDENYLADYELVAKGKVTPKSVAENAAKLVAAYGQAGFEALYSLAKSLNQ